MKVSKSSNLFAALRPLGNDRIIPYMEKWLVTNPHAGLYQVDDRPHVSRTSRKDEKNFYPSGDCMKCERLLYYERDLSTELPEQEVDAQLQSIFKLGSSIHAMIQAWLAAMSKEEGYPHLVENEMGISGGCFEGYGVGGYIDSVIIFPGSPYPIPIEIKSIGSNQFARLGGPKPEHRLQVGCYIAWLESPFGIVLYFNKDTCEMREYKVEPVDLSNVLVRWSNVRRAVRDGSPDFLAYGCKPNTREWERCPAKNICFGGFDGQG